jgi:hypothetical protein
MKLKHCSMKRHLTIWIIRLLMTGDKPRNIGFTLHGHTWKAQIGDSLSRVISTQGAISVGGVYNIELEGGANQHKGDYLYRSGSLKWDVESGMWGILRIKKHNMLWYCQRIFSAAGNRLRNLRRVKKNVDMDRGLKTGATNNNND